MDREPSCNGIHTSLSWEAGFPAGRNEYKKGFIHSSAAKNGKGSWAMRTDIRHKERQWIRQSALSKEAAPQSATHFISPSQHLSKRFNGNPHSSIGALLCHLEAHQRPILWSKYFSALSFIVLLSSAIPVPALKVRKWLGMLCNQEYVNLDHLCRLPRVAHAPGKKCNQVCSWTQLWRETRIEARPGACATEVGRTSSKLQ